MDRTAVETPSGTLVPILYSVVPGPRSVALCDTLARVECPSHTARRARRAEQTGAAHDPIVWAAARGSNVVDVDGNVFVDMTAGFGAALIGYGHPHVLGAVHRQADAMTHALGDVYPSAAKIGLEDRLASIAPWPDARVVLGLSGSDAVEAALKTAVLATGRAGILAFDGGYHGLAHGPLAACGYSTAFRAPFQHQLNPHVAFVPYPAIGRHDAIAAALAGARSALNTGTIGALLIEPILGRGGVLEADPHALGALIALARERGALVIADEMYTGLHRAGGGWCFSATAWPEPPGMVCLGKALGGTLPVSACLIRHDVAAHWGAPGGEAIHTSTFLGNPLGCAAALANLDVLAAPDTHAAIEATSAALWNVALRPLLARPSAGVLELGGRGLLVGVHLAGGVSRALRLVRALLERGYIVLPCSVGGHGGGLALTPPLTLSGAQIEDFARTLSDALDAVPA